MEINIYFKNVGQGDTIIIDWQEEGKEYKNKKFAMIDCNLINNGIEPIIKHINDYGIKQFEFVLMSHPHSDHFSGFLEFLDYCEINNIIIKKFLHTAAFDPRNLFFFQDHKIKSSEFREILTASVNRVKYKNKLLSLFSRLSEEYNKNSEGFIKDVHSINNDYLIFLEKGVKIKFLAPHINEVNEYLNGTYHINKDEKIKIFQKTENNPKANLLSTILQIFDDTEEWQIILCSDTTSHALKRIYLNNYQFTSVKNKKLLAAQIPHHGSDKNHVKEFWDQISRIKDAFMIISVGDGYGHPDISVVEYFEENAKCIHATNFVGGYKAFYSRKNASREAQIFSRVMSLPGIEFELGREFNAIDSDLPVCCEKHLKINIIDGDVKCIVSDLK